MAFICYSNNYIISEVCSPTESSMEEPLVSVWMGGWPCFYTILVSQRETTSLSFQGSFYSSRQGDTSLQEIYLNFKLQEDFKLLGPRAALQTGCSMPWWTKLALMSTMKSNFHY